MRWLREALIGPRDNASVDGQEPLLDEHRRRESEVTEGHEAVAAQWARARHGLSSISAARDTRSVTARAETEHGGADDWVCEVCTLLNPVSKSGTGGGFCLLASALRVTCSVLHRNYVRSPTLAPAGRCEHFSLSTDGMSG